MTKAIKLSLATAIAVSGFSATTLSAASLEESIKNTDISGKIQWRHEYESSDSGDNGVRKNDVTRYQVDVKAVSKVNENITSTVVGGLELYGSGDTKNSDIENQKVARDKEEDVRLKNIYFTGNFGATEVKLGKQDMTGVFWTTDDVVIGNGLAVTHKLNENMSISASHFQNTQEDLGAVYASSDDGDDNTLDTQDTISEQFKSTEIEFNGKFNGINVGVNINQSEADGNVKNTNGGVESLVNWGHEIQRMSLAVGGTFGPVKVGFRHSTVGGDIIDANGDSTSIEDGDITKLSAGASFGLANVSALIGKTSEFSSSDVAIDGASDAVATGVELWNLSAHNKSNATFLLLGAGYKVTPAVKVDFKYAKADWENGDVDDDASELFLQASYSFSKNFNTFARTSIVTDAGQGDEDDVKTQRTRLHARYSF